MAALIKLLRRIIGSLELGASIWRLELLRQTVAAVVAGVAVVTGWLEGVPTPFLMTAAILVFGGILWSWHYFLQLWDRTSARWKLAFDALTVDYFPGSQKDTRNVQMGIKLLNHARFPVYYRIESINAVINGKTEAFPKFRNMGGVIPPKGRDIFQFPVIEDVQIDRSPVRGRLSYQLKYGKSAKWVRHPQSRDIGFDLYRYDPGDSVPKAPHWRIIHQED